MEGQQLDVGISIGIALFPQHGEDAETLMRLADMAMYAAKREGGGYSVYEAAHGDDSKGKLALTSGLRQAMEQDELLLHYQPRVSLRGEGSPAVEALVRWQHPEHGLLEPSQFIPLAERTGLIRPLTHWVLDAALRQCRAWRQAGMPIGVTVNLTARNLQDQQLPAAVSRLLRSYGVPPEVLTFDITESVIMTEVVLDVVKKLSELRVGLCVDDFGTGYSTLATLKALPVKEMKIDRSFVMNMVRDEHDSLIVRSTIDLAHQLGLLVVAEGVDSPEVWNRLTVLGCDVAQGYYVGRPMPAAALERWVEESRWKVFEQPMAADPAAGVSPLFTTPEEFAADFEPLQLLRASSLFSFLPPPELEALARLARVRSYSPGDTIFRKEAAAFTLYLIVTGTVKISLQSADGGEVILAMLPAGELFGEMALFDDRPRTADATAVDTTQVLLLQREDVLKQLEERPRLATQLLRILSERLRVADEAIQDIVELDVPTRVAKRLIDLVDSHGTPTEQGSRIGLRLTTYDLASMVGAARSHVGHVLRGYEDRGWIRKDSEGYFVVTDERQLRARSMGETPAR